MSSLKPVDCMDIAEARAEVARLRKRLLSADYVIDECNEALADYEDTHDGDEGRPIANAAMRARTTISEWRCGRV